MMRDSDGNLPKIVESVQAHILNDRFSGTGLTELRKTWPEWIGIAFYKGILDMDDQGFWIQYSYNRRIGYFHEWILLDSNGKLYVCAWDPLRERPNTRNQEIIPW